ncbi:MULTISPECIES: TerD family protein [unclassified Streptomyces]|uniref:TerD family protein n=1 Tax=unclassified Streptomyces TaxID=2593676 RepID=UPI00166013C2|nr:MULTISPECIES: TerD family protein [unclassified Streptomyces]MBD0707704.1 TerD-family protein [Streptomyces sp. CBMA291]MBD0714961.1 TerD-family protein [Streptomyces sp. CBMA370]
MSGLSKGIGRVEVALKWDPAPSGAPVHDLDLIAGVFTADDAYGAPAQLVHFGSRSPDGTITLLRDSRTGQGFGYDEAMTVELERLAPRYTRVVVGVAIQQGAGRLTFGDIGSTGVRVREGYTDLLVHDFADVPAARSATIVEFVRGEGGDWSFRPFSHGFDADPQAFSALIGSVRS